MTRTDELDSKDSPIVRLIKAIPFSRRLYHGLRALSRVILRWIRVLRLKMSELFLPREYFIQIQSKFAIANPGIAHEQREYDSLHDWPDMRDGVRIASARMLLRQVANCSSGDYAEVGTYRGNFARVIYKHKTPGAKLYCFDTFEGFDERDVRAELGKSGVDTHAGNFSDTNVSLVVRNICGGTDADDLVVRKGFFPETFSGIEEIRWRFVLLDPDLYQPVKSGLELFWPRLVPGGIIMIDDCVESYYKGVGLAVAEFFEPKGIHSIPVADRSGTVVFVKPGVIAD